MRLDIVELVSKSNRRPLTIFNKISFYSCNEDAVAEVYFETDDKLYHLDIEFNIIEV